jgi:predicted outer membrane lipoprotein
VKRILVGGVLLLLFGIELASAGVYIDPMTMEVGAPAIPTLALLLGSLFGIMNTLWIDHKARIRDDPNQSESSTPSRSSATLRDSSELTQLYGFFRLQTECSLIQTVTSLSMGLSYQTL